ncbi:calcium-activated chloride channel regulator 1-like [Mytilus trossulus]|uniref:calcium-activated chloride channel regulator 1-like n=1 Tax=Mytilus trossulus TaxID=6551 RepID=UPI003004D5E4
MTIHIQQNGYKGIVVSISEKVSEDQLLLSTIQTWLTEASHKMYIATKYHVYLREITIIIPSTWSNNGAYSSISSSIAKKAHVKIGEYPDYKSPFAWTYGKCGKEGLYIHFTTDLLKAGTSGGYGNLGIVFTHEWGHFRWGIFDEYPTVREKGQLVKFYQYDGKYEPVRCITNMEGEIYDLKNRGKCSVDDNGKPDHNCHFSPHSDHRATAKASIMGHAYIKTMSMFCDGESTDPTTYHNRFAPNNQNTRCSGKSAWEIMRQHSDFKNTVPRSSTANTVPTFRILQVTQQHKICLVIDVSGSMQSEIRQTRDSMASLIKYGLPNNSYVGIVKFSSAATLVKGLTLISTDADRSTLVSYLPTTTGGSTSIGAGLQKAYQALSNSGNVNGSIIYLATDGQENIIPLIADVQPTLLSNGITIHSLAISNAADSKIQDLAFASGGKSYFYSASSSNSTALLDALTEPFKDLSSDALIRIKSVHVNTKDQDMVFKESFFIDGTVGRETVVQLIAENLHDVNLTVSHEEDVYTIIGSSVDVGDIAIKIPGIAGIGEYKILITSTSINGVIGTISIQSRARTINADVIQTDVMTEISNFNFTSNLPFPLYVSVLRGANPVIRASVKAYIENQNGQSSYLLLKDNAVGADFGAGDGIYSGYILPNLITANGRQSIKVIIEGYNASVVISKPVSTALTEAYGEVELQEESIGQFMRVNLANEVVVSNYVQSNSDVDVIPPSPILTLHLMKVDTDNNIFTLGWTAVGDDFDTGTASAYDLRISANYTKITTIPDQQVVLQSEQIPNEAGSEESFSFRLNKEGKHSTYFVIVRAVDDFNNTGDISNVVTVTVINDPLWLNKPSIWSSGFRSTFLISISSGVALILIVVLVSCVIYITKRRGGGSSKGPV